MLQKLIAVMVLAAACSSSSSSAVLGDGGPGGIRDPNAVGSMGGDAGGDVTAVMTFPTCEAIGYVGSPRAMPTQTNGVWTWPCQGYGLGAHACALCGIGNSADPAAWTQGPPRACIIPPNRIFEPPARGGDADVSRRGGPCIDWLCVLSCSDCVQTAPRNCEAAP